MKLFIIFTTILFSCFVFCDESKQGININIELLKCLDEKIPNNVINDPEHRTAKSLLLFPSIIDHSIKTTLNKKSESQFTLAMKYCAKEILAFKALVEKQVNEL